MKKGMLTITIAVLLSSLISVSAQTQASGSGQIRRLDLAKKEVVIKQSAIADLNLPEATLTYKMGPAALATKAKPGDSVKFKVEKTGDSYVVTEIK